MACCVACGELRSEKRLGREVGDDVVHRPREHSIAGCAAPQMDTNQGTPRKVERTSQFGGDLHPIRRNQEIGLHEFKGQTSVDPPDQIAIARIERRAQRIVVCDEVLERAAECRNIEFTSEPEDRSDVIGARFREQALEKPELLLDGRRAVDMRGDQDVLGGGGTGVARDESGEGPAEGRPGARRRSQANTPRTAGRSTSR
jgi:hypothetical protein